MEKYGEILKKAKENQLIAAKEFFNTLLNILDGYADEYKKAIEKNEKEIESLQNSIEKFQEKGNKQRLILHYNQRIEEHNKKITFLEKKLKDIDVINSKINYIIIHIFDYELADVINIQKDMEKQIWDLNHKVIVKKKENIALIEEVEAASKLVQTFEQTENPRDFKRAFDAVNSLPECKEKSALSTRIQEVREKNEHRFNELKKKILKDIDDKKDIIKDEIDELVDRVQYLDDSYMTSDITNDYINIINTYNNQVQNDYQKGLTKKDIKKYSRVDIFVEMLGGIVNFFARTKKAAKVNKNKLKKYKNKLEKYENKLDNAKTDKKKARYEKKKAKYENKIEKVNKSISEKDIVSNAKLFIAKNKLAKMKPKLYKEGFNNSGFKKVSRNSNEKLYQTRATNKIAEKLSKGLSKRLEDESISKDKSRVITILDQYLELVASGTYDKKYTDQAMDYLEKVKDVTVTSEDGSEKKLLSDSEYIGYKDLIQTIYVYRDENKGMPYHMNNTESSNEVDDVIRYYDSDAYSEAMQKGVYVKGK